MPRHIKLIKVQQTKLIQLGRSLDSSLGNMTGNLTKKSMLNYAVLLANYNFSTLVTNVAPNSALNAINKFEGRISQKKL